MIDSRGGALQPLGTFCFVFHSHIPYARQAGRWPHGEEWIHEAAAETYVPLVRALHRLQARRLPVHLTLSLTPILLEQLADPDVKANFLTYLEQREQAAANDLARFDEAGEVHLKYLADLSRAWFGEIRRYFAEDLSGDLVAAFRELQRSGVIEVITCAATHGYLPLLGTDASIQLQLRTAVESYQRHMGVRPRGIWLPECAYRPGYLDADDRPRPGLETFLEAHGLTHFFAETHMVQGGRPVGMAGGEGLGPYGAIKRRYLVPFSEGQPARPATTYQPYLVADSQVAVMGRENRTGLQVWSADWGYPGDYDYREFHKKDAQSGMRYWRVTGAGIDLADKDHYQPEWAAGKVTSHAKDFADLVARQLREYRQKSGEPGLICAMYDTELFGHWWFEGVDWIEAVLENLASVEEVELSGVGAYLDDHPPRQVIQLPEGSWGAGGTHFVWDNGDNRWMWPLIHQAEADLQRAAQDWKEAPPEVAALLDQAARELLLLQSSDWPFLISTGQAKEYATQRFQVHLERFNRLLANAASDAPDPSLASEIWERDKVFPEIDYRWFSA